MRAALLGVLSLGAIALGAAAIWTALDSTPAAPPTTLADGSQGRLAVPSGLAAEPVVPEEVRSPDPPDPPEPPQATTTSATTSTSTAPAPPPPPAPNRTAEADQAAARAKFCTTPGWACRTFTWEFRGGSYWLVMELDTSLYATYRTEEKPVRLQRMAAGGWQSAPAYDLYVSDPRDDRFVGQVATELRRMAGAASFGPQDEASFVLAFVQSLQYTSDNVTTGFDEYPRYPIETLVDDGGDCEDTSILYASLMQALGVQAILVSPPTHMAVGLDLPSPGPGVDAAGRHYTYAETTGEGWEIGEVPPEFAGQPLATWSLVPTPLFALGDTSASGQGSALQVDAKVTNMGTATADATVVTDVRSADGAGTVFATDSCFLPSVPLRGAAACSLHVDLRTVPVGASVTLEVRVESSGSIGDALATAPFVPWH